MGILHVFDIHVHRTHLLSYTAMYDIMKSTSNSDICGFLSCIFCAQAPIWSVWLVLPRSVKRSSLKSWMCVRSWGQWRAPSRFTLIHVWVLTLGPKSSARMGWKHTSSQCSDHTKWDLKVYNAAYFDYDVQAIRFN